MRTISDAASRMPRQMAKSLRAAGSAGLGLRPRLCARIPASGSARSAALRLPAHNTSTQIQHSGCICDIRAASYIPACNAADWMASTTVHGTIINSTCTTAALARTCMMAAQYQYKQLYCRCMPPKTGSYRHKAIKELRTAKGNYKTCTGMCMGHAHSNCICMVAEQQ